MHRKKGRARKGFVCIKSFYLQKEGKARQLREFFTRNFSARATRAYIPAANTHRIAVAAMTRSSLKTWPPYTIRYPKPAFDTMYSPIMEPIQAMPTHIFSIPINCGIAEGMTSFVKICSLLAPIDRSNSILF